MNRPLDTFASANRKAVELARAGKIREAVHTYAHGGAYVGLYINCHTLDKRAEGYGHDRQVAMNETEAAKEAMAACDRFVLKTRDLPMPDDIRQEYGRFIDSWRADWRARFGVWAHHKKARYIALRSWQFAKACRREGLL